mgnify:CR=1 FL=1
MCSILGQISFQKNRINHEELVNLNSLLSHRGPDDKGYFKDANISLAFNRLSIIDLKNGNQPINTYNIISIFNGEIYNFKELKNELIKEKIKSKRLLALQKILNDQQLFFNMSFLNSKLEVLLERKGKYKNQLLL